ncbi:retrovirus-related pol polyprotein from transposon TNT 1-94 [Tanacetum coccineum]
MAAELPQTLEYRSGQLNDAPLLEDFQDSPDDEEDTRSSQEYMDDLKHKPELRPTKDFEAKYNKVKAKLALLSSSASASKSLMVKNKGLIAKAYEWDEEEVSFDDNEMVEVKVLMTLADDNDAVSKEGVRNGEWVNISMRKRILGVDQLTEDSSSSRQKDIVFVKSLADDTKVSIPGIERPWLSEAEGFILPNHDTGRTLPAESQMNTTDPLVAVTDSSATKYDPADESSVCSTLLPPLEKLGGAEPVSGPKTIKSIIKSNFTFKAEALKSVIINEKSLAPVKVNKKAPTLKINLAPAGKLKNVKTEDDFPLAIVPPNALQKKYKTQFKKECELCGVNNHLSENCYKVVFCKNCERTDYRTCDHAEYIRGIKPRNSPHVLKGCKTCGSTVHTTSDHNEIEWFRRGEALQAKKAKALKSKKTKSSNATRSKTPTKSGCSRHMTGVKSYLHKYVEQPGPKVVFGDDSTCVTKGYGSIKFYLYKHKDYLRKFDEKADDGYFLGYALVSKAFRVFNTRKQQTEETYHITFDESTNAIKFIKPLVDNVNIAESEKYPPDEYLHHYEPSQRYQVNNNKVSFIEPYERPGLVVLETKVSSNQNDYNDQNDQSAQTDEILNDGQFEHSNHNNDDPIIENLINNKDVQNSEPTSSPVEDALVQNTIPNIPSSSIPSIVSPVPQDRWSQDKHIELVNIIGDPGTRMLTRAMAKTLSATSAHECLIVDFLSEEEPKKVFKALKHPGWVDAMQDELNQFARNKVWKLVPAPNGKTIIRLKWVFRKKRDETRIVIKNKARLVAQGYNQQEGVEYDETFAPIARIKAIRIFLAFSTYMNFIVYQMDVKSAFLNGKLKEEFYVKQHLGFESNEFPNHVCKLDKALYGLKQVSRAWYETLSTYLTKHKFLRDPSAQNCIKQSERGISINQEKYVKDLLKKYDINGSSVKTLMVPPNKLGPDLNGKAVNETQYRGMFGSLMYLTASRRDIQFSTCLCARYQANPKESYLIAVKRIFRYLEGTPSLGLWYPKCLGFDLKGYSDSDYAGCNMGKKSTSAEAEYVAAARCYANILWMKSQLTDYDIIYEKVPIFCDNTSAIAISNNPVLHSRTKHIDNRYHFIRDHILKGDIELHLIPTQYQLAHIFTKPLDEPTFKRLIIELGMLNIDSKPEPSVLTKEN